MKKLCGKCKAFSLGIRGEPMCSLGYPIDPVNHGPTEECPKPLTYLALVEERNEKNYHNNKGEKRYEN